MSRNRILRMISQILLGFFVFFSLQILFAYFRGDNVNVLDELIDTAVLCIIYFPINFYLQHKNKTQNTDNSANEAE